MLSTLSQQKFKFFQIPQNKAKGVFLCMEFALGCFWCFQIFDLFRGNFKEKLEFLLRKCRKHSKTIPRKFHAQRRAIRLLFWAGLPEIRAKRMNLPSQKAIFPNQPSRKKVATFFLEGVRTRILAEKNSTDPRNNPSKLDRKSNKNPQT